MKEAFTPVAVNVADEYDERTTPAGLPAGSASRTYGGIVNVPRLAGTWQTAETLLSHARSVQASTAISRFPEPPVQFTINPLARVAVPLFTGLTNVAPSGIVTAPLNGPTSAPPAPANV